MVTHKTYIPFVLRARTQITGTKQTLCLTWARVDIFYQLKTFASIQLAFALKHQPKVGVNDQAGALILSQIRLCTMDSLSSLGRRARTGRRALLPASETRSYQCSR